MGEGDITVEELREEEGEDEGRRKKKKRGREKRGRGEAQAELTGMTIMRRRRGKVFQR